MNLLLLEEEDFLDRDRVEISGDRFMHAKKIIRAKEGTNLACGKVNGKMGTGRIITMNQKSFEMAVDLDTDPPPSLPLTLVLALPRPKMLKRILQSVTSLGVKEIYLINSWRVENSFWLSDLLEKERLDRHLKLGLAQAKDTLMPIVHLKRYFTTFVREELPGLGQGKIRILAHPKTSQVCPAAINEAAVLVIGPEGGFIDQEVDTLAEIGFESYTTGHRILRVETAVSALISRLYT